MSAKDEALKSTCIGQDLAKIYYITGGIGMCLSKTELQRMEQIDIKNAAPDTLVDISEVTIDMKKSVSARVEDYVRKVGNPFLVKVGDYVVKIGYSDCPETLNDRMKQYIKKVAEIRY